MSANTACRERALALALSPGAGVDAPLTAMAGRSASFRLAAAGELGAWGSDGGERVPLAAAMVTLGCCWRCASDGVGWNALRAAGVVLRRFPSQHALSAIPAGAMLKFGEARDGVQDGFR